MTSDCPPPGVFVNCTLPPVPNEISGTLFRPGIYAAVMLSPPAPWMGIGAWTVMPLYALSVSVWPLDHAIRELMMMSPAPATALPGPLAFSPSVTSVTLPPTRLLEIVAAAFASTTRFIGSTSHSPAWPFGADVLTRMPSKLTLCPDVSTNPPLPPSGPPLAAIRPATLVRPFDHTTPLPQSPLRVGVALIE